MSQGTKNGCIPLAQGILERLRSFSLVPNQHLPPGASANLFSPQTLEPTAHAVSCLAGVPFNGLADHALTLTLVFLEWILTHFWLSNIPSHP